jgi:hypothetical protein
MSETRTPELFARQLAYGCGIFTGSSTLAELCLRAKA